VHRHFGLKCWDHLGKACRSKGSIKLGLETNRVLGY
jgi:hypothetical protein